GSVLATVGKSSAAGSGTHRCPAVVFRGSLATVGKASVRAFGGTVSVPPMFLIRFDAPDRAHEVQRSLGPEERRRLAGEDPHPHVLNVTDQEGAYQSGLRPDLPAPVLPRRIP